MATRQVQSLDDLVRALFKLLIAVVLIAVMSVVCLTVALSFFLIKELYFGERPKDILDDQTYAAVAVFLAVIAFATVWLLMYRQGRHSKYVRRADHRQRTRETVLIALKDPIYAQCWGPRFSPGHVDERLFFYCGFVVLNWAHAWDDRLINDAKLRQLLKAYFDSEVPRMYWERNGDWHQPRRRWPRRMRFLDIVNEEYLSAIKAGPPARPYEPFAAESCTAPGERPF
jgi:hypothetical protein